MPHKGDGKQISIRFSKAMYLLLKEIADRDLRNITSLLKEKKFR